MTIAAWFLNSKEVSWICKEFHPDLILLYIMMPYMDRLKAMNEIKTLEENERIEKESIQILVLTAHTDRTENGVLFLSWIRQGLPQKTVRYSHYQARYILCSLYVPDSSVGR